MRHWGSNDQPLDHWLCRHFIHLQPTWFLLLNKACTPNDPKLTLSRASLRTRTNGRVNSPWHRFEVIWIMKKSPMEGWIHHGTKCSGPTILRSLCILLALWICLLSMPDCLRCTTDVFFVFEIFVCYPNTPCMECFPTFSIECSHL